MSGNGQDAAIPVEKVIVGGRSFVPAYQTTFEQDFYLMDRSAAAGMDEIVGTMSDGSLEEFAKNIILRAYRNGVLFELLGGVMMEEGVAQWTPEVAKQNADFFASLTAPEDKQQLQGALVGVLLGFFVNADGSLQISPKSSASESTPAPEPAPVLAGRLGVAESSEVRTTSGNGET